MGLPSSVMEKHRLLANVYGRRPGDVTIPVWRANKGLAIDVCRHKPLRLQLPRKEPCENYAESKNTAYYDKDFKGTAYEFAAMVFETTGGVNEEGSLCSEAPKSSAKCLLWSCMPREFAIVCVPMLS